MTYTIKVLVVLCRNQGKYSSRTLSSTFFADFPIPERDSPLYGGDLWTDSISYHKKAPCFLHVFWSPSRACLCLHLHIFRGILLFPYVPLLAFSEHYHALLLPPLSHVLLSAPQATTAPNATELHYFRQRQDWFHPFLWPFLPQRSLCLPKFPGELAAFDFT